MQTKSSPRPTIGILTADCAPAIGGIGRHVETLCAGLRQRGHDVRIFDLRRSPAYALGRGVLASAWCGPAVRAWVKRENIGIVHAHTGPGGALLWKKPGVPLVVTANHTYAQQSAVPGQAWKRLLVPWERRTYACADAIACISPDTRDVLAARYAVSADKLSVIPCGIDVAAWAAADAPQRPSPRCVFIGRPDARKGWDLLCTSWKQMKSVVPDATLDVVGFTAQPMDGVTYHARLDDGALRTLVGSARLLLMPSRIEGFGLAAAEAIAAGTPVLGCNVAGLRSVVDSGRTGVLVPVDAPHVAAAGAGLLLDAREWGLLQQGCRAVRQRFDAAREIDAYEAVYAAVYSRP
jgi:glycosyltransferase involved in cell wall biosynthesis